MPDDHRKYRRISMMNSAELMLPGDSDPIEALVDNVSYGGIGLYIPEQMTEGPDVIVRIVYNEGKPEKFAETIPGTVRWCRPFGTWYGVGIEFKYLSPKEHGRLLNYLDQASGREEE
jgi:hypothetical protein